MKTLSGSRRATWFAIGIVSILASCGGATTVRSAEPGSVTYSTSPVTTLVTSPTVSALEAPQTTISAASPTPRAVALSPLAAAIKDLPSALYEPEPDTVVVTPTAMSIPSLGVRNAPVIGVSVNDVGELDVPDPTVVGWYKHSPTPGGAGASVLASHVDFNGVPGVFFYLSKLKLGATVTVSMSDATEQTYVVREVALFDKDELPTDRVWTKDGAPSLVLFTCGGRFNSSRRSFEDNIVAFADPVNAA
jgi:sortase (surface protein transpeptidase)